MLLRLYHPGDFPQLYAIEQLCFQPPFRFSRPYMQELISNPDSATWIAEEDRQIIGFTIVEWNQEENQTTAYIQTLEVIPTHRKQGIATALLSRLESSAAAAEARVLWLHVAETNTPAVLLYQAHGYQHEGREENYYPSGIPALIYAKLLDLPQ